MNQAVTPVTLSTSSQVRTRSTARRKTPPSGGREGQSRCSKRRRALRRATGYTGRVTPLRAVRRSPHSVDRSRSSHDGGHDDLELVEAQGVVSQHRDEDGSEGADGRDIRQPPNGAGFHWSKRVMLGSPLEIWCTVH